MRHTSGVEVQKTCTPRAEVGDLVTYGITISNTGNEPLTNITVMDSLLGNLSSAFSDTLAVGGTETETFTRRANTAPDPLVNTATVSARGADSRAAVSDTDSCSTDVLHPSLSIVKTPSGPGGAPGTLVTFTYVVKNTGDTTLFDIAVDDDKLGHVGTISSLAPGASVTMTKTTALPNVAGAITNVGTASGIDILHKRVTATDTARVSVVLSEKIIRHTPRPGTTTGSGNRSGASSPEQTEVEGLAKTGTSGLGSTGLAGMLITALGLAMTVAGRRNALAGARGRISDSARALIDADRRRLRLRRRRERRASCRTLFSSPSHGPPSRDGP